MPEGPEVRRYADKLHHALAGREIVNIEARTKAAKAWLSDNPDAFKGLRVLEVRSRGKNLIGCVEGGLYWYSHLMMWGRWMVVTPEEGRIKDRRERARIEVADVTALLWSAPVFEVGRGEPLELVPTLRALGPDALPYNDEPPFDGREFRHRLCSMGGEAREVGAALLDQTVCAGIGNYLRADILFECRLDPFRLVGDLSEVELQTLTEAIPRVVRCAYETGGATLPEAERERMRLDPSLRYGGTDAPPREYGTRHWVFRRTNLPCLRCDTPIRQLHQTTRFLDDGDEKSRIIYFCPQCQGVAREKKTGKAGRTVRSGKKKERTTTKAQRRQAI